MHNGGGGGAENPHFVNLEAFLGQVRRVICVLIDLIIEFSF